MAKQKILIIVITRADIPKGRGDDEFIEDWGQGKEQNIYWLKDFLIDAGNVYILVLHGCNENSKNKKYPILFEETKAKKGTNFFKRIDKAYLCYHGVEESDLKTLRHSITNLLEKAKNPTILSYSSSNDAHNFAISDLLNQLEVEYQLAGLRDKVFDQLQCRPVIIQQLHCLQSELLRLQFCIATIVSASNNSKQNAIDDAINAVSKLTEIIQRKEFNTYYQEKIKLQVKVKKDIEALFDIFRTINGKQWDSWVKDNLQEELFWKKRLEQSAYNRLSPNQLLFLERDFRFLARAMDCLLDAASI